MPLNSKEDGQEGQEGEYANRSTDSLISMLTEHSASVMDRMETISMILKEIKVRLPFTAFIIMSLANFD